MIISHKHKFIFFHIPKCAGSSIFHGLCENLKYYNSESQTTVNSDIAILATNNLKLSNSTIKQHLSFRFVDLCFNIDLNDYFKFSFVRNPWDRLISYYFYQNIQIPFNEYAKNSCDCQFNWIKKNEEELGVDFVGKTENLQEDFDKVCETIGIDKFELSHRNKSQRPNYQDYYNEESKRYVLENYKKDIDIFNYNFNDYITQT